MGGFGVIAWWKLKRELARLGQQLQAIPEAIWEPFALRAHNAAFEKGFPLYNGEVDLKSKVAIVLCYQPKGLAASFFITLDHLVKSGYSPLVMSNTKLSKIDLEKLRPHTWRTVERPNFGYDFGGYRDGIFSLRKWNIKPERLVILNDSIWFPVWEGDATIKTAENSQFDVVGFILREKGAVKFLESYFLMINTSEVSENLFYKFWDDLKLTSNKYNVIRRGERGFGVYMGKAGLKVGSIYNEKDFLVEINSSSLDELRLAIDYACADDKNLMLEIKKSAKSKTFSVASIRSLILNALHKRMYYSTFPVFAAKKNLYPAIKKSDGAPRNKYWRSAMLQAFENQDLKQPYPDILNELTLKVQSQPVEIRYK
jgi:hypothetical protein